MEALAFGDEEIELPFGAVFAVHDPVEGAAGEHFAQGAAASAFSGERFAAVAAIGVQGELVLAGSHIAGGGLVPAKAAVAVAEAAVRPLSEVAAIEDGVGPGEGHGVDEGAFGGGDGAEAPESEGGRHLILRERRSDESGRGDCGKENAFHL